MPTGVSARTEPSSRIGVPGLMEAIRAGRSRRSRTCPDRPHRIAGDARLPAGARRGLLGRKPVDAEHRDLVVRSARSTNGSSTNSIRNFDRLGVWRRASGPEGTDERYREELTPSEQGRLRDSIALRGLDYVGQEVVRLSTTPRWSEERLEPRPFVLRVYCAASRDGWRVMPGGFCRISDEPDARAVSMGDGVESADVWVLAQNPVETTTLSFARDHSDHAVAREPAEPRRRQPLLVRALSRTSRGHVAPRALSERPFGRSGRAHASWPAIPRKTDGGAGRLGSGRCGGCRGRRDCCEQSGTARPEALRLCALSCALGPPRGFRHSGTPDPSDLGADRAARKYN